jgi:hypothetical protein
LSPFISPRYFQVMRFSNSEDRLNPIAPEGTDETTLGGYPRVHGRAAAFEGCDGQPYTAAIETEHDLDSGKWAAYLVFLRWAESGTAIMGHVETGDLTRGDSQAEALAALESWPLTRVKDLLDEEIRRREIDAPA